MKRSLFHGSMLFACVYWLTVLLLCTLSIYTLEVSRQVLVLACASWGSVVFCSRGTHVAGMFQSVLLSLLKKNRTRDIEATLGKIHSLGGSAAWQSESLLTLARCTLTLVSSATCREPVQLHQRLAAVVQRVACPNAATCLAVLENVRVGAHQRPSAEVKKAAQVMLAAIVRQSQFATDPEIASTIHELQIAVMK